MKSCAALLCACAALVALAPAPATAQLSRSFFIGGGPTIPTGSYGDYAKTGWMGAAGFTLSPAESPVWFGAEGLFGRNSHEASDVEGGATELYGGNALIGYDFGDAAKLHPYIYGSGGVLVHHWSPPDNSGFESESETKLAVGGGAGLAMPIGGAQLWAEAKFLTSLGSDENTGFIPILIGVSFGGG